MARSRNIKPSFFTNDTLAECEALARILFAGLWTIADREGRLHDRPKRIKAEILPYDQCDCNMLIDELQSKGFLIRYKSGNDEYIQIVNFQKHQNPHVKEPSSTIPAPDKHHTSTGQAPVEMSLIPHPDSLNPHLSTAASYKNGMDFDIKNILSDDGWMDARSHAPGWDIHNLAGIYNEGIQSDRLEKPKYPNKAFPAWCKSYTKGKRP